VGEAITMAALITYAALAYLGIGVAFAIAFALRGAQAIDSCAVGSHWGFRVLVIPGAAALWPIMLRKWIGARSTPREAHR
jgi:hypothetical protein